MSQPSGDERDLFEEGMTEGNAALQRGDALAARQAFEQARQSKPELPWSFIGLGHTGLMSGDAEAALEGFTAGLERDPTIPDALYGRADALFALGRFAEAAPVYLAALERRPTMVLAWRGRGRALHQLKSYVEALACLEMAIFLGSQDPWSYESRALCLMDAGRVSEALASFEKALSLKADLPYAWQGKGDALSLLDRHAEALLAYEESLALRQDIPWVWMGRGKAMMALSEVELGEESFRQAARGGHLPAGDLHAAASALARKEISRALADVEKAHREGDDSAWGWALRGRALAQMEKRKEALAALQEAVARDPKDADSLALQGDLLMLEGDRAGAVRSYAAALSTMPEHGGARKERKRLVREGVWDEVLRDSSPPRSTTRKGKGGPSSTASS